MGTFVGFMDRSPKNREIEPLKGDGTAIQDRGQQIVDLSNKMLESSQKLKDLKSGDDGQKGDAIVKIREVVGKVYEELERAGNRYSYSGSAFKIYGQAVERIQPLIADEVESCQNWWQTYRTREADVPSVFTINSAGDDDAKKKAQDDADQKQDLADDAKAAFDRHAEKFDSYYDEWEDAFDHAASQIKLDVNDDLKDHWRDNVDGFVAGALAVLKVVGLVLAVLVIVVGGPILGAIAAIVGVVTLALVAWQYFRKDPLTGKRDASKLDLALAVLSVVPFGKLGGAGAKLFAKDAKFLTRLTGFSGKFFGDGVLGGLGTKSGLAKIFGEASRFKGIRNVFNTGFIREIQNGSGNAGFATLRGLRGVMGHVFGPNGLSLKDGVMRTLTGKELSWWQGLKPGENLGDDIDALGQIGKNAWSRFKQVKSLSGLLGGDDNH